MPLRRGRPWTPGRGPRAGAVEGTSNGPWSTTGKFRSRLVGFTRNGKLYDPLIHGETVGERLGDSTFIPGKRLKLDAVASYVRYMLPATITNGEFSMDVEGLGNALDPLDSASVAQSAHSSRLAIRVPRSEIHCTSD